MDSQASVLDDTNSDVAWVDDDVEFLMTAPGLNRLVIPRQKLADLVEDYLREKGEYGPFEDGCVWVWHAEEGLVLVEHPKAGA